MEQLSQHQRRRVLIKQLLQLKDAKQIEAETQNQTITASQKRIDNCTLEAQIKQFDCLQIQNYTDIKLYESILCRYSPHKKAQFLCCSKYCDNHAIMCAEQTCKCVLDHHKCTFISIKYLNDQIASKMQQLIPKQIELYFQVKSVIYEHMANRISQERQALMDWQKDICNDSALFLYVSKVDQTIKCHTPKVGYQKIHYNHQKCCVRLQIRKSEIKEDKEQIMKAICKKIQKKYCSMIEYFDQKVDQLQYHKKYANLNSAQLLFIDLLKNMNVFIEKSEQKQFDLNEGLKKMKIMPSRVIYLAQKYNKKQLRNLDWEKFSINRIRKMWKGYSEKVFRSLVEGKVINELFLQMDKLALLKIHSVQGLRSQIDTIIQSISQGQGQLFSNSILTKKLKLTNLKPEQLCKKLKKYKSKDVKFDQVYISNDRLSTSLNEIETIKELGNLKNVKKLEIKWCIYMKAQVSMEILNTMPHLKQLALLNHCQKLSQNFMSKLCQFKQLTLFYINCESHPKHYSSLNEDGCFIDLRILHKDNLAQTKELMELSKLPKLQNIQISQVKDVNSAQVIKNIKQLRHFTLGYHQSTDDEVDVSLIKQLCEKRALITISLIGVKIESKQLDDIITNNPNLKTIIIRNSYYDNENINDETVECMANLIQLQNLCIIMNTAITGKNLSKLDKLIMLEIGYCQNVSKKQIKEALTNMHKLQHLQISGNQWFDDEVVASVQSCKQLAYLNIQRTSVSCEGLKHLQGLTRLNIFICGRNNINGKNLIELTKKTARITRLGIGNLDVNDNELLQISENCQALTHLNIYQNNKITAETLLKIKRLKVVCSKLNQDCKKKLREAGIQSY